VAGLVHGHGQPALLLLEGIVLHAFDGKASFGPESRKTISRLKAVYGLDLDSRASHRLKEANGE
jgi:hypothetical protein